MNESRQTGNGMNATHATGWLRDHSSRTWSRRRHFFRRARDYQATSAQKAFA
jgi:hypothetical protein